jgi:putative transposase
MHRPTVQMANQRWAMDFVHDTLATGAKVRVFTLIDGWRRECLGLRVASRLSGNEVASILAAIGDERPLPAVIQCDSGTEFTSTALDHWAYWNKVQLDFSRPGKRVDRLGL